MSIDTQQPHEDHHRQSPDGRPDHQAIHIFVRRGQQVVKLEFETNRATGLDIKTKAGGSPQDGLYFSHDGKNQEVADAEVVTLHEGMHFTLIPNGRVS